MEGMHILLTVVTELVTGVEYFPSRSKTELLPFDKSAEELPAFIEQNAERMCEEAFSQKEHTHRLASVCHSVLP